MPLWPFRKRSAPPPVVVAGVPEAMESVARAFQAALSTHEATIKGLRAEVAAAIAARDARDQARDAEIVALRAELAAWREHGAHLTTRMNALTGLVNRKLAGDKAAMDDEVRAPLTVPGAGGLRAW